MNKKLGVLLITFFSLTSTLTVGSTNHIASPVHQQFFYPTIIYVDDDFEDDPENHLWNTIQKGITDARNGDTIFVYEGVYFENVVLDKTVTLLGEQQNMTIIDAQNKGDCLYILSDNVTVSGFTLRNSGVDIYPLLDAGIDIKSYTVTIKHCNLISNNIGILIQHSNNLINNCVIAKNDIGFQLKGNNNTLINCEITNNSKGITAEQVKKNSFSNLYIQKNNIGIHLVNSQHNLIQDSIINSNTQHGIILEWTCDENKINRCNITNNGEDGIHIYASTDNNIISQCHIANNDEDGIEFFDTVNNNIVLFCDIINNVQHGINSHWILTSPSNRIHYSKIYGNGIGIHGEQCQPNAIYNWWGSHDGPSGAGNGQGDEITDNVVYIPWLNEPPGRNTPPSIEISSPLEGETVKNGVEIVGQSSDSEGLEDLRIIEISIDNGKWHRANGTNPWRYYDITMKDGLHVITARAFDYINYSELHQRTIQVDTISPLITILFPTGGESIKGTVKIQWEASDNQDDHLKINLSYSSTGQDWHEILANGNNSGTYDWNTSTLQNGEYILRISATDDAGNSAHNISEKFSIDSTLPTIKIIRPKNGFLYIMNRELIPTISKRTLIIGKITIETFIDSGQPIKKTELYLDDSLNQVLDTPPYEFLLDEPLLGKHSISVMAYDIENRYSKQSIEPIFINW